MSKKKTNDRIIVKAEDYANNRGFSGTMRADDYVAMSQQRQEATRRMAQLEQERKRRQQEQQQNKVNKPTYYYSAGGGGGAPANHGKTNDIRASFDWKYGQGAYDEYLKDKRKDRLERKDSILERAKKIKSTETGTQATPDLGISNREAYDYKYGQGAYDALQEDRQNQRLKRMEETLHPEKTAQQPAGNMPTQQELRSRERAEYDWIYGPGAYDALQESRQRKRLGMMEDRLHPTATQQTQKETQKQDETPWDALRSNVIRENGAYPMTERPDDYNDYSEGYDRQLYDFYYGKGMHDRIMQQGTYDDKVRMMGQLRELWGDIDSGAVANVDRYVREKEANRNVTTPEAAKTAQERRLTQMENRLHPESFRKETPEDLWVRASDPKNWMVGEPAQQNGGQRDMTPYEIYGASDIDKRGEAAKEQLELGNYQKWLRSNGFTKWDDLPKDETFWQNVGTSSENYTGMIGEIQDETWNLITSPTILETKTLPMNLLERPEDYNDHSEEYDRELYDTYFGEGMHDRVMQNGTYEDKVMMFEKIRELWNDIDSGAVARVAELNDKLRAQEGKYDYQNAMGRTADDHLKEIEHEKGQKAKYDRLAAEFATHPSSPEFNPEYDRGGTAYGNMTELEKGVHTNDVHRIYSFLGGGKEFESWRTGEKPPVTNEYSYAMMMSDGYDEHGNYDESRDERGKFMNLYNEAMKEGREPTEARAYMEGLLSTNALQSRYEEAEKIYTAEAVRQAPVSSNILAIGARQASGFMAIPRAIAGLFDESVKNPNSAWWGATKAAKMITDESEKQITERYGELAGKVYRAFGESVNDVLTGLLSSGMGGGSELFQRIFSYTNFVAQVAQETTFENMDKMDYESASLLGWLNGLSEYLEEKAPFETMLGSQSKGLGKAILESIASNAAEEGYGGTILEKIKGWITGRDTEQQRADEILAQRGYEDKNGNWVALDVDNDPGGAIHQANLKASAEYIQNVMEGIVAGGLGGGFGGTYGTIANALGLQSTGRKINSKQNISAEGVTGGTQLVEAAAGMTGTESQKMANEILEAQKNGKKPSNYTIGKLAATIVDETSEQMGNIVKTTVENRVTSQLQEKGLTGERLKEAAGAITRGLTDGKMSRADLQTIARDAEAIDLWKSYNSTLSENATGLVKAVNEATKGTRSVANLVGELTGATGTATSAIAEEVNRSNQEADTVEGAIDNLAARRGELMSSEYAETAKAVAKGVTNQKYFLDDAVKIRLAAFSLAEAMPKTRINSEAAQTLWKAAQEEFQKEDAERIKNQAAIVPGKGKSSFEGAEYGTAEWNQKVNGAKIGGRLKLQMNVIADIAQKMGNTVDFIYDNRIERMSGGSVFNHAFVHGYENGSGAITINVAGLRRSGMSKNMLATLAHEMTHWLEQNSNEGYAALRQFVVDKLGAENVQKRLVNIIDNQAAVLTEESGDRLNLNGAMAELVAQSSEGLFSSKAMRDALAEENPTLFNQVKKFVRQFLARLDAAIKDLDPSLSDEARQLNQWKEDIAKLWLSARNEALGREAGGTEAGEDVSFSLLQEMQTVLEQMEQTKGKAYSVATNINDYIKDRTARVSAAESILRTMPMNKEFSAREMINNLKETGYTTLLQYIHNSLEKKNRKVTRNLLTKFINKDKANIRNSAREILEGWKKLINEVGAVKYEDTTELKTTGSNKKSVKEAIYSDVLRNGKNIFVEVGETHANIRIDKDIIDETVEFNYESRVENKYPGITEKVLRRIVPLMKSSNYIGGHINYESNKGNVHYYVSAVKESGEILPVFFAVHDATEANQIKDYAEKGYVAEIYIPTTVISEEQIKKGGLTDDSVNIQSMTGETKAELQQAPPVGASIKDILEKVNTSMIRDFDREGQMYKGMSLSVEQMDKDYQAAVEREDWKTAEQMLLDKMQQTEGITGYNAPYFYTGEHQDIAKLIKSGDQEIIQAVVQDMAQKVPDNAVLIPMPPHEGKVLESTDTMILARALSEATGRPVINALESDYHESRYAAKAAGKRNVNAKNMGFRQIAEIPEGTMPVFIDNMVGGGQTEIAAKNAIGRGITLAYAQSARSKSKGVKFTSVTYDNNGNLIPLSQRMDPNNPSWKYSVAQMEKKSIDELEQDYEDAYNSYDDDWGEQIVAAMAEKAFPDSKVRDENGRLKVVYHQTNADPFTVFNMDRARQTEDVVGAFFAPEYDQYHEYGDRTYAVYLNITNPKYDVYDMDISQENAGLKKREELIAQGYDGVINTEDGKVIEYVAFYPEQIKSAEPFTEDDDGDFIPLIQRFNTFEKDIRYSVEQLDQDYSAAVKAGDMETAQRMVDEAAERALKDSKMRTKDGKLRKLYHGTYSGEFSVFDPSTIGSASGDIGFFGQGFYFAYTEGEASYYGNRVMEVYLDIKKPYNYEQDLLTLDGNSTDDYNARRAVFVTNFAEKFPELANQHYVTVYKKGENNPTKLTLKEFADEYRKIIKSKKFTVQKTESNGMETWKVYADRQNNSYTNENGEKFTWIDYGYEKNFYSEKDAKNQLTNAYMYLAENVYDHIEIQNPTIIIMETDFSKAVQDRGYDGIIQSEEGDEAVVFSSNQIKRAAPVTKDDDGNVIPLSERFNTEKPDIRFSVAQPDMEVTTFMQGLNENTLSTEQERVMFRQWKDLKANWDLYRHAYDERTRKLQALEAKENPTAYDREEMRRLRNMISNSEKKLAETEAKMVKATTQKGFAKIMSENEGIMRNLVSGKTSEQVRATIDALTKDVDRITKEMDAREKEINILKEDITFRKQSSLVNQNKAEKMATQLRKEYGSSIDRTELIRSMIEIRLKMMRGLNINEDVEDLAWRVAAGTKGEGNVILNLMRGRTIVLGKTQLAELKGKGSSLKEVRSALAGTGIKVKTGETGTLDADWSEWCDIVPSLNRNANSGDQLDEILDVVADAKSHISGEDMFKDNINDVVMDLKASIASIEVNAPTDPAAMKILTRMNTLVNEMAEGVTKSAEELRQTRETLAKLVDSGRMAINMTDRMQQDIDTSIKYNNALAIQSEAATWKSERWKLIEQLKSETTQKMLEEQMKWREKIAKDKKARDMMATNQQLRRQIHTNVTRLRKLLVNETDLKNIPEHMKSLTREVLGMIVKNDLIGRKITGISKQDLQELARVLGVMSSQDGAFTLDDLRLIADEEAQAVVEDALADLEDGIGFYNASTKGGTILSNLQGFHNALERISEAVATITNVIHAEQEISLGDRRILVADAAEEVAYDMQQSKRKGELQGTGSRQIKTVTRAVGWGNLTPVYFFKNLKNRGMAQQWKELERAENRNGLELQKANAYIAEVAEKAGYKDWAGKKMTVKIGARSFDITVDQAMALYAVWKREKTSNPEMSNHLQNGGVFFQEEENTKGKLHREKTDMRPVKVSDEDVTAIYDQMTDAQKTYIDDMVRYLSNEMSELGNEASMRMYGIKKYKEPWYFPMQVWDGVKSARSDKGISGTNENRAAHKSWSKRRINKARNALVIGNFTDIAVGHIVEMINYNTVAPAIENLNKVLNYQRTEMNDPNDPYSGDVRRNIRVMFQQAYGTQALEYLETFLNDLNGGTVQDKRKTLREAALSMFKKNAVAGSLSVTAQQPLSYIRAAMMISPSALVQALNPTYYKGSHAEMMKYSGVAVIKEMGRFDMGFGASAKEYVGPDQKESIYAKVSDKLTVLPELMDRMTWTRMWSAVKIEQHKANPGMDMKSEEFLQKVAERFNEVMRATQVYDSVMVKSQNMRSQNYMMKLITSFMAEPTVSLNVLTDAVRNVKQTGGKKILAAAGATYILSAILQSFVKGLMGSGRSPDDDKTWLENFLNKWWTAFQSEINPFGLIPGYSDMIEVLKNGELKDDALGAIGKLKTVIDTTRNVFEGKGKGWARDLEDTVAQVAQLFTNIPAKNLMRDTRAMANWVTQKPYAKRETSGAVLREQWRGTLLTADDLIGVVNSWLGEAGYQTTSKAYYQRIYDAKKAGNESRANDMIEYLQNGKGVKKETIDSGLTTIAKADSSLTVDQKAKLLTEKGENVNETWWKLDRDAYKKESGKENVSGNYYRLVDAINNNSATDINRAVKDLLAHGFTKEKIKKRLSDWKSEYLEGDSTKRRKIRDALQKAYKAIGLTPADADKTIENWTKETKKKKN